GWTYVYDGANRLKQATAGGGTSTYGYDGDGMRVRQTANGGTPLYYVRSSVLGQVVMEVNSSQGVYRTYVYAGKKLVAERSQDGNFYWVHTNHLGNERWLTDVNGNSAYRGEFDPYGQLVYEWGTTVLNSRKFTGYERDAATGLDYANARMYRSERGRFMQPDPMGLGATEVTRPESLNRYSYVWNDPVNLIDPSGLFLPSEVDPGFDYGDLPWPGIDDEPRTLPVVFPRPEREGVQIVLPIINIKFIKALRDLPPACQKLLASKFGGNFEEAINVAQNTTFIDINSNEARTGSPAGAAGRSYRDIWEENLRALGGAASAAAIPSTSSVVSTDGKTTYKYDYKGENTVLFDPKFFGPKSPSQSTILAHEFFHIAFNLDDASLAKELGLDYSKIAGPTDQAKASQAISKFIDDKCQK
ncbi:MAG: hypothetical protein L0226_00005, partial [Acidobacteria bacterium]|nr:hypothetical protein [Acidobacteriota bacterium]